MLHIADKAPEFILPDKESSLHSLQSIHSKYIVVYFYPKDDTPGCTIEAQEFSKAQPQFTIIGATVIGISGGDQKTKAAFCQKHGLNVLLLSDTHFEICKKYGVYGEKSFMGKKYMGIQRVTFVLDEHKDIIKVFDDVKPAGHAQQVLEFLKVAENPRNPNA